jgi:hypothetical protein
MHHQGIIPAFAGTGLQRIALYASVVTPRRLASNSLLVIRNNPKPFDLSSGPLIWRCFWDLVEVGQSSHYRWPCNRELEGKHQQRGGVVFLV